MGVRWDPDSPANRAARDRIILQVRRERAAAAAEAARQLLAFQAAREHARIAALAEVAEQRLLQRERRTVIAAGGVPQR